MTRTIDLTSKEWLDLIFANKNQIYVAYEIRKTSSQRHLMSLGIVILLGAVLSALPMAIKKLLPAETSTSDATKGIVTLTEYDLLKKDKEIIEIIKPVAPPPELKATIKFTPPVIKPNSEVSEADEIPSQVLLSEASATISIITNPGVEGGTFDPADFDKIVGGNNPTDTGNPILIAEEMPQFVGGDKELMSYLSKNIKYPIIAQETGVQGTVTLRFVVGKDGNIKDVTILRSLDPSCDKEAVRVVKSMPQWIPGKQNGIPVAVYYTIPVKFKLNN